MQVTHQHDGVIIDRSTTKLTQGICEAGVNILFAAVDGNLSCGEGITQLCHLLGSIGGSSIIDDIQVLIGDVRRRTPVGFNGDGAHAVRHVEVGTLREHTSTDAVQVFIGTLAVGKVIVRVILRARGWIVGDCIRITIHSGDAGNLPSGNDLVARVVLGAYVVVVRQLHLVVVEVKAFRVLVRAGEGEAAGGDGGTIGSAATLRNGDREGS